MRTGVQFGRVLRAAGSCAFIKVRRTIPHEHLLPHKCGLTPRSRRGPTASHQARAGGTLYIFTGPGLASCRRSRLNSNVRPRKGALNLLTKGGSE